MPFPVLMTNCDNSHILRADRDLSFQRRNKTVLHDRLYIKYLQVFHMHTGVMWLSGVM